ncbi:MAG: HlyD family efflux transporter periplasmic adaptor subunit [Proteobacteria bacterium]|nr:HlyD family efflux transporter periplasmic adaptor subunit [Pseudomonadota bacterium]
MNQPGKPSTVQLLLRGVIASAVLAIGVAILSYLVKTRPQPPKVERVDKGELVEVLTVRPTSQVIEVSANGQVVPAEQIALSAEVAGRIQWLATELIPGGRFDKNDVIARIDRRDYVLAAEQQAATVDSASTALEIERSQKAIAEREWKILGEDKPASALALRGPQMRTAQASLKAAQSGLKRARLSVDRTVIRAPFNAMVQQKSVALGQLVGPQAPLATLIGTDAFWVQVSIPVDRLKWIRIPGVAGASQGSPATISQKVGDQSVVHRGKVIRLLGDLDPVGRMARVLVEIPDPLQLKRQPTNQDGAAAPGTALSGLPLLVGSYVEVVIQGRSTDGIVEITRNALRGGDQVFLMTPDSTLDIRDVEVVWRKRDTVLIASGLGDGDRIVVSPLGEPTQGMKLRIDSASGSDTGKAASPSPESPSPQSPSPGSRASLGGDSSDNQGAHKVAKPSR